MMKTYKLTDGQYQIIRNALERYWYDCRDDSELREKYCNAIEELEKSLIEQEDERELFVIQAVYDGSFYRATWMNNRNNHKTVSYTNVIKYAKVFDSKDDREFKEAINLMGEDGYDYRLLKVEGR